jgi:hypothetical protein
MIGRDSDVLKLSAELIASRFVTIVGTGGVGKTTVAVAVAHHLVDAFAGSVLFVDLGMLSDPKLAATTVASMQGLSVQSDDAMPGLIAYLRDKLPSSDSRHLRTSHRSDCSTRGKHHEGRAAGAYPRDEPRDASRRR